MPPLGPRPRPGSSHTSRRLPGHVVSAQTGHAQKLLALLEGLAVVGLFAARTSWTREVAFVPFDLTSLSFDFKPHLSLKICLVCVKSESSALLRND